MGIDVVTLALAKGYTDRKIRDADYGKIKNPDWNQNNKTAPDYVKNRPFYTGDPVETEIIPETTVTFSKMNGLMATSWPESFDLIDGQTYTISWDGTDYVCIGILFNGTVPVLGNLGIAGAGEDTGEPFIFINQGQWLVGSTESATEHVISISGFAVEVVKINEKYLPESAFTNAEWAKISNKIVDYKQQSLSLSASGEPINIGLGVTTSSNIINDKLKFEHGMVYKINGSITLHNPSAGGTVYTLSVNGYYTCSNGRVTFGSLYDGYYRKSIEIGLYSSSPDDTCDYGKLSAFSTLSSSAPYTFDINITVTEEAKQLPDICIGENIQRVGDDIILSSSTADSTKKFKIIVDDSGKPTFTNPSDSTDFYTPTDLPSVTASDSGKFLRVSSAGEWVAETVSSIQTGGGGDGSASGQLIVTVYNANVSGTVLAADKTYNEISTAIESGMSVILHYKRRLTNSDYSVFYLRVCDKGYYRFFSVDFFDVKISLYFINIYEKNGEMVIEKVTKDFQIGT